MLDIFYLTYLDDYSKENFERIKELALPGQNVIHVKDIDGIYNGHKECALQSSTKHFFVIDGDGWVLGNFDFSYVPNETDEIYPQTSTAQCTHVWRAVNPATGQTYGYGGVKLFAREAFMDKAYIDIQHPLVDVTTEVAKRGYPYLPIDEVSNETRFATTPFNAWKSAFRETTKLASGVATQDRRKRIDEWRNPNEDVPYHQEIALGAKMGENYGTANTGNGDRLFRINNWKWLQTWFKQRKKWKPQPVTETIVDFADGRFMLSGIQKFVDWIDHPHRDIIDDVKNAVMLERDDYIQKCVDWLIFGPKDSPNLKIFLKYYYSGKQKKFNPERCIHYMYEMHDSDGDFPFFGMFMGAVVENKEVNFIDALAQHQVESKIWLIERLEKLNETFNKGIFIGGWLGISSYWAMERKLMKNVTNLDLDDNAIKFSDKLNSISKEHKMYKGIVGDASTHDYSEYDLVINTSSEHMTEEWFDNIKEGTTVAIQTNDFHDIEEHINTVRNLKELEEKYPLSKVLFSGVKDCDRYNRFMMIGIK